MPFRSGQNRALGPVASGPPALLPPFGGILGVLTCAKIKYLDVANSVMPVDTLGGRPSVWGKRLLLMALGLAVLLLPQDLNASLVGGPPSSDTLCESAPPRLPLQGTTICLHANRGLDDRGRIRSPLLDPKSSMANRPSRGPLPPSHGGLAQPLDLSLQGARSSLFTSQLSSDDLVSSLFTEGGSSRKGALLFSTVVPLSDYIARASLPVEDDPPKPMSFTLIIVVIVGLALLLYCNALIFAKYLANKRKQRRRSHLAGERA